MITDTFCTISEKLRNSIISKKQILDSLRPFPNDVLAKLKEQMSLEWTFNSNAIEGNTLTLQETEIVLKRGITIGNKNLREHFEALNHDEAIKFLESFVEKKEQFTIDTIKTLHKIVMKNINDYGSGSFRKTNVKITGAVHIPPEAFKIENEMQKLIEWYNENKNTISPFELASWLHYHFVWIHPFIDGNGRVARLLMNLTLIRSNYSIAIIPPLLRGEYISALEHAHEDVTEFCEFIAHCVLETQKDLLRLLETSVCETAIFEPANAKERKTEKTNEDNNTNDNDRINVNDRISDRINDRINNGADEIYHLILSNPGINANGLSQLSGKSIPTVNRKIAVLKKEGKIEFRGAKKTGGYYPKFES